MSRIKGFCCNYTLSVDIEALKKEGLVPEDLEIERLPCTGRLEVPEILDAFTEGADAVFVVGCQVDKCHNLSGSYRASKRVKYAKKILEELDINPDCVEMFFAGRGETEPVVEAARTMASRVDQ
ncbi:MAG: hydrogenase iron-sulfur subunit [Thermodesulfobacteria bacterium]|nr:hydrogenase iron-sulfur subunit [Thermodesulfobacteriota bacterium]